MIGSLPVRPPSWRVERAGARSQGQIQGTGGLVGHERPHRHSPQYFDQVLSAYGLTMVDASKAPPTYAHKDGDKVVWEMAPRTYTPQEMDQILSAYGATLDDVSKARPTYARAVDGKRSSNPVRLRGHRS